MPKSVKNKNPKIVHPYSRKAQREERKIIHKQRVQQVRSERSTKLDILDEKIAWFHERLDDRSAYTKADLVELLDNFRHRFDEELEQISIVYSVGVRKMNKQHVSRQTAIHFTMEMEKNEFESIGIEVPDLVNKDNLFKFKQWNGEIKYIQNFKLKKISVRDHEKLQTSKSETEDSDLKKSGQNDGSKTALSGDNKIHS